MDTLTPQQRSERMARVRLQDTKPAAGWQSLVVWECELRDQRAVEIRVREFLDA